MNRLVYEAALVRNHRRMSKTISETDVDGINGLSFAMTVSKHLQLETRILRRMEREKGLTRRLNPYILQWIEKLGVFHA